MKIFLKTAKPTKMMGNFHLLSPRFVQNFVVKANFLHFAGFIKNGTHVKGNQRIEIYETIFRDFPKIIMHCLAPILFEPLFWVESSHPQDPERIRMV